MISYKNKDLINIQREQVRDGEQSVYVDEPTSEFDIKAVYLQNISTGGIWLRERFP